MGEQIKQSDSEALQRHGFALINEDEEYKDFDKCEDLTKSENLRMRVTFVCETGKFYAALDIQSDYTDGCRDFGASDDFPTLGEALAWLGKSKLEFQPIIEETKKEIQTVPENK